MTAAWRWVRERPWSCLLLATAAAAGAQLATHAPFAVTSPDVAFHLAKTLRASEGDFFTDPFSGTSSIYPSLFHTVFGLLQRVLGWNALEIARLISLANLLGLLASAYLLARVVLRDGERAALTALAVSLVFYAPTGRHVLSESPGNFATPLLVTGAALVLRALDGGHRALNVLGCALLGAAVNVVWYDAVAAAAVLLAALPALPGRPPARHRSLEGAVGFLLPFAFTVWHFYSIRAVLPDYAGHVGAQVGATGGLVPEFLTVLLDRSNFRFAPLLERSLTARLHYYGLALPAGVALLAAAALGYRRLRREGGLLPRLVVVAALTVALSLVLAVTRDVPRLAKVQFFAYVILLPVGVALLYRSPGLRGRFIQAAVATGALLSFAYTLRHTDRPFTAEVPGTTRAVLAYLESLPGHQHIRVFVTEAHLRHLAMFVTFRSFVGHSSGRYYSQDPVSSARLLDAYQTILERRSGWRDAMQSTSVRLLIFDHTDPGLEGDAARFYLSQGHPVLANPEWWVIRID